jgi:predicted nicotinamide N-methyase
MTSCAEISAGCAGACTQVPVGCPLYNSAQGSWSVNIGPLKFTSTKRSSTKYYEDDTAASIWGAAWAFAVHVFLPPSRLPATAVANTHALRTDSILDAISDGRKVTDNPSLSYASEAIQTHNFLEGRSVIELGSGTGVAGLAAACAGASSVVLSDLPDNLDILMDAVEANRSVIPGGTDVSVSAVRWGSSICQDRDEDRDQSQTGSTTVGRRDEGNPERKYDVVLAVDCIYCHTLHEILAATAVRLCKPGGIVLIADELRWTDSTKWWEETALRHGLVLQSTTQLPIHERISRGVVLREYTVDRTQAQTFTSANGSCAEDGDDDNEDDDWRRFCRRQHNSTMP